MKYAFLFLAFFALLTLSSCAFRSHDYYNHTQIATSDTLRDIVALELIDGSEIHFEGASAVYSSCTHELKGRTEAGRLVVVPLDQIASCVAAPSSWIRSGFGVFSAVAAIVIAVVVFLVVLTPRHR